MPLSEIVNVTIDRQTRAVSTAGFGTLLIAGDTAPHNAYTAGERVRYYSDLDGVAADYPPNVSGSGPSEYYAAAAAFSQSPAPTTVAIAQVSYSDLANELSAVELSSGDWYGLITTVRKPVFVKIAAAWVQARRKIYVVADLESDALTTSTTDLAGELKAHGYDRTALIYLASAASATWPEAAWLGRQLATVPGAQTWMFKTLAGISASHLNTTESKNARDKNVNTYESIGGVSITREGRMCSGEYIDVMVGMDWLHARLSERIYGVLVNLPKVPYTDAGVAIFEAAIRAQLDQAVSAGVLASVPPPTVTVPRVRDVAPNDRANRLLPDLKFNATLAGAVHAVTIRGVVTV